MSLPLNPAAEEIRKEIKQMIPETATEGETILERADRLSSDDGRILYSGESLLNKVVALRTHIEEIGDVFILPPRPILPVTKTL